MAAGAARLNEAQAAVNPKGKRTCITVPFSEGDGVEAWRDAARKMLKDPEYVVRSAQEAGPYPQIVGDAAVPIIRNSVKISPAAKAWITNQVKVRYKVDLDRGRGKNKSKSN